MDGVLPPGPVLRDKGILKLLTRIYRPPSLSEYLHQNGPAQQYITPLK